MRTYSVTNLPVDYREFFLKAPQRDDPHAYNKAKAAAEDAISKAVKKVKTTSAACVNLRIMEDNYLQQVIKFYKDDETLDEEYRRGHVTFNDIILSLPDDEQSKARDHLQMCLFAIDLLDTHIRVINGYIKTVFPSGGDDNIFSPIQNLAATCAENLRVLHHSNTDIYENMFAEEADRIDDMLFRRAQVLRRKLERIDKRKS